MSKQEILSVKDLSLVLHQGKGSVPLVNHISFTIQSNRIMGLIGESGCGKSLTCLSIMGILPKEIRVEDGNIWVLGKPLSEMRPDERAAIRGRTAAMILQNPMSCFDSVFKIRNHFLETMLSHGEKNKNNILESSRKALIEVGFENPDEILDLYPFQMSGGMLQRIMVALALMMRVSLLIADEPTTDLDVVSQERILALLERMRKQYGMSILLVTHDLSVIARLADDVVVMKDGWIVEAGSIYTIFEKSRHPYTKSLLEAHFSLYGTRLRKMIENNAQIPGKQIKGDLYECVGT